VAKHNGLTFAPVFIVNLRAVFGRNRAHSLENGTVFICMDLRKRPSQKFGRLLDQPWGLDRNYLGSSFPDYVQAN
jgi:hypothetical protein